VYVGVLTSILPVLSDCYLREIFSHVKASKL